MKESVFNYLTEIKGSRYKTICDLGYDSDRYNKSIYAKSGTISDGATFFPDVNSWFWLWHDILKDERKWQDGSHCSNWQASVVCFDILISENRYILAAPVFLGTLIYGYTKQLFKGLK